jgi:anthranilate phosphoribosyltransferase
VSTAESPAVSPAESLEFREILAAVVAGRDLTPVEVEAAFGQALAGEATPAQIGALLAALATKGESVAEIAAAARLMRRLAVPVPVADRTHLVDTCGTGGDARHTFNISTTAALVAAAAGARVAKHGNRSVSSRSGSADVLEAAGVRLDLPPAEVGRCIDEIGVGFLFAPAHHGAARHVAGPRRELGIRTIFNLLGPLTNPAMAPSQVLGVYDGRWVRPLAEVLRALGSRHVLVVHGADGLDEISISGPTRVVEVREGLLIEDEIAPEAFGLARGPLAALTAHGPAESLALMRQVLAGEAGPTASGPVAPARDIVCLNAGAALYVAGVAFSLAEGVERAAVAIASGAAREKLAALVAFTQASAATR